MKFKCPKCKFQEDNVGFNSKFCPKCMDRFLAENVPLLEPTEKIPTLEEPINVVCLKHGTKYGDEYVNKLYYAVERNVTVPHKFYCFTDNPHGLKTGINIKALPNNNIQGWWQKLYLFSKDIGLSGRIFYLDLDTVIVGNIDHFLVATQKFIVLRDLFTGFAKGVTGRDNVGSAIMAWDAGKHCHIWDSFAKKPTEIVKSLHPHGDQKWIQTMEHRRAYWQDFFPGQVVSFKKDCGKGLPSNTKIVCFHGRPSIPDAIIKNNKVPGFHLNPAPWIRNYWKDQI